jgi:pimeloyl-ACP methyl ester carboxylesterase
MNIAEALRLPLGGIDQYVLIRGRDVANPVLVALHGGPGTAETPLLRHFNSALEEAFTVVYWEQRGTGKSFSKAIPETSMTVDRFVRDLDELVDYLLRRLGRKTVVLFGHSWGTALGTLYAARYPQKVSAYIGTGQIGDLAASELASYRFVLDEAKRRGNSKAIAELTKLGPPPYTDKQMMVQRRWLGRFAGTLGSLPVLTAARIVLLSPGSSIFALPNIVRGTLFSVRTLWGEVSKLNLERDVPELKMPVWFLNGRHDHQVDAGVAAAYFEKLTAPEKTQVWFENSGHFVPFEEPEKFNKTMCDIAARLSTSAR